MPGRLTPLPPIIEVISIFGVAASAGSETARRTVSARIAFLWRRFSIGGEAGSVQCLADIIAAMVTASSLSVGEAVETLCASDGYLLFEGYYSPDKVREARERTYELAATEPDRTSHFHGDEAKTTQKRVWNLPEKGEIFRELAEDPYILSIMEPILGDDLMLASYAANILHPGAPAQEPHVDYPYWDLHAREHWPQTLNASFFLAVETVLMLDDFTVENGASAILPGSQKLARWPDQREFESNSIRVTGPAGSLFMFPALLWHAGQRNDSQDSRGALLASYTCKSIKPIEDWSRCISQETIEQSSDPMKALLGVGYAYPVVMDNLTARSSEGARSKKGITE